MIGNILELFEDFDQEYVIGGVAIAVIGAVATMALGDISKNKKFVCDDAEFNRRNVDGVLKGFSNLQSIISK